MQAENKIPEINIIYGKFLDPIFTAYVKSNPKWKDIEVPTKEEVLNRIRNYKEIWNKNENQILEGMCDVLELGFKENVIEVFIVSLNPRSFNRPVVIKSGFSQEEFLITLAHELIHCLLSGNSKIESVNILKKMFPEETQTAQNHIIVHSVLKYIYLDVLEDKNLLAKNLEKSREYKNDEYKRAWEIVDKEGHKNIIENFKKNYKNPHI